MGLISTNDLRVWMGVEEGDVEPNAKLSYVARAIEDFVDSYTNRQLLAQTYFDDNRFCYLDGTGRRYIYLPQQPVSYVSSVNIDSGRDFGSGTLLGSADFFWYPSGKIMSEGGYFTKGHRNIKIHYTAGYAPVSTISGTHDSAVSSYPIPNDLKQVMVEMSVESIKEGMTAVHSIQGQNTEDPRFIQLLGRNSFWKTTLNRYKDMSASLAGLWE